MLLTLDKLWQQYGPCTSKLFTIYFSHRCSFCPPSDITLSVFFWHQKLGFFMTRLLLSSFDLSSSIAGSTLVLQYVICISLKPSVMSFYTFFTNLRIVCKTGKLNAHMLVVSQFVNLVLSDPWMHLCVVYFELCEYVHARVVCPYFMWISIFHCVITMSP